jgi:creatinine amidohydrolase/Fe(II)-dependent formamide hydrolase-like protein
LVRQPLLAKGSSFTAADGVYGGDPTRSSATLGQLGVDLIVAGTIADIRDFVARQAKSKP